MFRRRFAFLMPAMLIGFHSLWRGKMAAQYPPTDARHARICSDKLGVKNFVLHLREILRFV